ncbi:MAG: hypothetical protein M3Z26_11810 [Bacteroidota bacterium]|nr:hypothetical protein [Bacteroidota bacterium]
MAQEDYDNRIYNFTVEEFYSYDDVAAAAALRELMHTTINYKKVKPDMFMEQLKNVAYLSILRVTF